MGEQNIALLDGPDPDNPGWNHWNFSDQTLFNAQVMGPLIARREGDKCRLRMVPQAKHKNLQGSIHGGVTLALIDVALFATMEFVGSGNAGPSVTLELSNQFIGAGNPDKPLDAVSEIVRETGRLAFVRGEVVQGDQVIAAYSGIVRKFSSR